MPLGTPHRPAVGSWKNRLAANDMQTKIAGEEVFSLLEEKFKVDLALRAKLQEKLLVVLGEYALAHGEKAGLENACDDLFRIAAQRIYPGGWTGLLHYAVRAAG